jgi:hypothetical protein
MDQILHGEDHFYESIFIQCQSYHDNYVCSYGGVAMSGGDGTDSGTQVPTIRRACLWPRLVIARHSILSFPKVSTPVVPQSTESLWAQRLGAQHVPSQGDEAEQTNRWQNLAHP